MNFEIIEDLRLRSEARAKLNTNIANAELLFKQVTCTNCDKGCDMCKRPCWGTPQDIQKLIDNGYANRLMLDYFYRSATQNKEDIKILCPATRGFERKNRPAIIPIYNERHQIVGAETKLNDGCIFFKQKLCQLHDKNLKPFIGKASCCSNDREYDILAQEYIAILWDSDEAKTIVHKWETEFLI